MWFVLNTCFPSGRLEFGYMLERRCLCDQHLIKTLGTEIPVSFLGKQHFTCYHNSLLGKFKHVLYDSTGRRLLKTHILFSPKFALWAFPFTDFSLYPFTVINHSHEGDNILSPVSPFGRSLSLGVILETPNVYVREWDVASVFQEESNFVLK